jgi:putative glycosyltransferase (TIGR04372 family)
MNLRVIKKKFRQEVILDVNGCRNSNFVIARKFLALCFKVLGGLVLTLVLAPISLVRPIEIWNMQTKRSKISFFIRDLEYGLKNIKDRKKLGRIFVFAVYPIPFPNGQLALMYRRHITIVGQRQRWIAEFMRFVFPIFRIEKKGQMTPQTANRMELWNNRTVTLKFTAEEIYKGQDLNRELGISPELPTVCIAFASKKYREFTDYVIPNTNNVRLNRTNNLIDIIPEIKTYYPVITKLASEQVQVVRTGTYEVEPLPKYLGDLIYDYSLKCQSAFGDVWLYSQCLFALAAGSGSHWFASIFNKPSVFTDQFQLWGTYGSQDLFIPQLCYLFKKDRLAPFDWMLQQPNYNWALDDHRLGSEYQIVKNSSEQIIDVTVEMLGRLNGSWVESNEDIELQARFRKILELKKPQDRNPARIGAKFLREHQYLLPD